MAITQKLNQAWSTNEAMDAVFEFRAISENIYQVLQETVARIDEIVADASFAGVDQEIKTEGAAIRQLLNQSKNALDGHSDFLTWRKPE